MAYRAVWSATKHTKLNWNGVETYSMQASFGTCRGMGSPCHSLCELTYRTKNSPRVVSFRSPGSSPAKPSQKAWLRTSFLTAKGCRKMIGGWSILHHLKRFVAWTKGTQETNVLLGWFHDAVFESFKEATSSDSVQWVNAFVSSKKMQFCSFILDSFSLNFGLIGHNQCHIITYHRPCFLSSYWHGVVVIILVQVLGVHCMFAIWAPVLYPFASMYSWRHLRHLQHVWPLNVFLSVRVINSQSP